MAISGKQLWIENSDVVSLFPTLLWKIQLRAEVHEPIDASALGLLHSREELHELCDCVSRSAASVLQFLNIGE